MTKVAVETIRELLKAHAGLSVEVNNVGVNEDLYKYGLTSFATVQLMLAIEEMFDVQLPEDMLNPRTFSSIDAISHAIEKLLVQSAG